MSNTDLLQIRVPLNTLTAESFQQLLARFQFEQVPGGKQIFTEGDNDPYTVYLLAGELQLKSVDGKERLIKASADEARYPVAQLKPRQYTGTAKTEIVIAKIGSEALDRAVAMDQTVQASGIEVVEFDGSDDTDWMLRILNHDAFQKIPPANINQLFARLEPFDIKPGQIVIKQGEPGDYYYLIKNGKVNVSRKAESAKVVVLGELKDGDAFGEEALLANAPRNATIVATTVGVLMRLNKKDFDDLLKAPLVKYVGLAEAKNLSQAGATLVDVRTEDEFRQGSLKGSMNLPLYLLRMKAAQLDLRKKHIVYCQTGQRSAAAAFLLGQRGFDVSVLEGGLEAVKLG
jgi:CRP-like cAMP-binding protein